MGSRMPVVYLTEKMFLKLKKGRTVRTKVFDVTKGERRRDGSLHKNIRVKIVRKI